MERALTVAFRQSHSFVLFNTSVALSDRKLNEAKLSWAIVDVFIFGSSGVSLLAETR